MSEESGEYKTHKWTPARLASYIDREGRLDDKRLLADINADIEKGIRRFLTERYNAASKLASREPSTQEVIEIDASGKVQPPFIEPNPHSSEPQEWTPERLARFFHDTYEILAPRFGYETRPETREFDPKSKNGRLMITVCSAVLIRFKIALDAEREQVKFWQREHAAAHARHIQAEKELTSNV
jgi:hypothetical protein